MLKRGLALAVLAVPGQALMTSEPARADEFFEKATVEGTDYCIGSKDANFNFSGPGPTSSGGGTQQTSGWDLDSQPWFGGYGDGTKGTESLAIALSQEINDVAFAYRVGHKQQPEHPEKRRDSSGSQ